MKFAPARLLYAQGATATVEPYHRSHRLGSSLRIAVERKNHLAIARPYNEANTVEIDESGTYKKRTVIKTVLCDDLRRSAERAATIFIN